MPDNKRYKDQLRHIPSVNEILQYPDIKKLIQEYGRTLITYSVRTVLCQLRDDILNGEKTYTFQKTIKNIHRFVMDITGESLKPVINATGIILHTNLGRAPFGEKILNDIGRIVTGYSNLEYDLHEAKRSNRNIHITELIRYLTTAEDSLIVNNNAAGIYLILNTFAKGKEVIVSRGELIEIGGSFRIPEIMKASGAKMVEVGTTNKTRIKDYESAISDQTALLFKAHKSNFTVTGFTEEVTVKELANCAHTNKLPMIYDIGSGLLQGQEDVLFENEPDIRGSLADGADLVTFSCDKLMGGPQAGIIAGKAGMISVLKSVPLMRVIRVGKLTLAALSSVCQNYIDPVRRRTNIPVFAMLNRKEDYLHDLASKLQKKCHDLGVSACLAKSTGQCGGGTLPDLTLKSTAVELIFSDMKTHQNFTSAELVFSKLLNLNPPVIGILREGKLLFDVLTVFEKDIDYIAHSIAGSLHSVVNGIHGEEQA